MVKLNCDLCAFETQGESFADWLKNLLPHYQQCHTDFMSAQSAKSPDEQKLSMQKWMSENKARFDAQ